MRVHTSLPRVVVLALLVSLCLIGASEAQRPLTPREQDLRARSSLGSTTARPGTGELGTGLIQYEPGAPADVIATSPLTLMVGNIFNSHLGLPLSSGTVSQVSWYQAQIGTVVTSIPFKVLPPGSPFSTAANIAPTASYAFQVATVFTASQAVGTQFFAGFAAGQGSFGNIGLRSATINTQGFHGVQRNFSPANSTPLPGQNAMVRIAGNVIIPVELLEFEVE